MKLGFYLKDKSYALILFTIVNVLEISLAIAFLTSISFIIMLFLFNMIFFLLLLCIDFFRKHKFYQTLLENSEALDKSYLVLETLEKPNFYEGQLLTEAFYIINKSYLENIHTLELQMKDFQEYIELWIHEVKIPISVLTLMAHNYKDKIDKKIQEQMKRIEDDVEQVLYYVRQETPEKDYLINHVSLKKVIHNVALKNKDNLLEHHIDLQVKNIDYYVYTDSKWLEFILNQIIQNAIQYKKQTDSHIQIDVKEEKQVTILTIKDNGIGIKESDLPRVCEKSFTGKNGREGVPSTGMGLYIVKNLCKKLGHTLSITSKEGFYTKVAITFSENDYYDVF